jgi:hypothetical protein
VITTFTPSLTSACAQALPRPLLAAQTSAQRPAIPRFMRIFLKERSSKKVVVD